MGRVKSNVGYESDDYEIDEGRYYDGEDIEEDEYDGYLTDEKEKDESEGDLWEEDEENEPESERKIRQLTPEEIDGITGTDSSSVLDEENVEAYKDLCNKKYSTLTEEDDKEDDKFLISLINNGTEEEKKYAKGLMLDKVEKFIHDILHTRFYTYSASYDQLHYECISAVLENMPNYDPDAGTKTTYFLRFILHACTEFITKNIHKTTPHYANKYKEIKPVMDRYSKMKTKFTTRDIALETGIPLDTIIKTIKDNNKTFMYIDNQSLVDNQMYDYRPSSLPRSPEEEYIKKEESDTLYRALLQIDHEDFEIFAYANGLEGNETYGIPPYPQMDKKDIAKKFHKSSNDITRIINFYNKQLFENDELYNMMKGSMNQDKKMFSKRSSSFVPIKAGQLMFEDAKSDMLITLEDSSEDLKIS